jgi:hypothetical protein
MRLAAVLFVVVGLLGCPPPEGADAGPSPLFPETPAGRKLFWLHTQLSTGGQVGDAELDAHVHEGLLDGGGRGALRQLISDWSDELAPSALLEVEQSELYVCEGLFITLGELRRHLRVDVEAEAPHRITSIRTSLAVDRNPAREAPLGLDEIGIETVALSGVALRDGVEVSVVDRQTLAPFDPPLAGESDGYGYARYRLPSAGADIAVRTVGIGGRVTYSSGEGYGGGFEVQAAVVDDPYFENQLAIALEVEETGSSHVMAIAWHGAGDDLEPVACAELTAEPALDNVYYSELRGFVVDRLAPHTWGTTTAAWSFNNAPGAHTLRFATDEVTTETTAQLEADAVHVVALAFDDEAPHPEPDGCYVPAEAGACAEVAELFSEPPGQPSLMRFVNTSASESYAVWWIDYGGDPVQTAVIEPGGSYLQDTFGDEWWLATDTDGDCAGVWRVTGHAMERAEIPASSR